MKIATKEHIVISCLGILIGIYTTYFLITYTNYSSVMSSALVGLIASIVFIKDWKNTNILAISMYCGSFAGMGNVLGKVELLFTSIIAVLLIIVFRNIYKGFGGKLGFIAYLASILTSIILNFNTIKIDTILRIEPIYKPIEIIAIALSSSLGFLSTTYLNHQLKKSIVLASALPSFIVGCMCYYSSIEYGNLIALTFFSASFVGMLSENLLQKKMYRILIPVHIILFILFKNSLGNYGGALGTLAFVSVLIVKTLDKK